MSGIGSGRGRGWLKLGKTADTPRPGNDLQKLEPSQTQIIPQEKNTYDELLQQFECLDPTDDGILLNEKIKHIRNVFMNSCKTKDEITKAVQAIHRKCLRDELFIEKFVMLITSAFFLNKQTSESQLMWRDNVRMLFFNHLQENFENRELLRKTTPSMFYNSLKLYSNFFRNCRKIIPNGYPTVETVAITGFLNLLLDHAEPLDISMFVNLVCENCGILMKLYDEKNAELFSLLDKLKLKIICDNKLLKNQKLLLFFAWDLIRHKYYLSSEELTFYKNNLGTEDIKEILIKYNYVHKLDIECPEDKNGKSTEEQKNAALVDDEKVVNHSLQSNHRSYNNFPDEYTTNDALNTISAQNSSSDNTHKSNNSTDSRFLNDQAYLSKHKEVRGEDKIIKPLKSVTITTENKEFSVGNNHMNNTRQNQAEKIGRPILGIGARLKRH